MSDVTNVILVMAGIDNDDWANALEVSKYLRRVDESSGGNKAMECCVFMAGINYLSSEEIIGRFNLIRWEWPESAQLMLMGEHDLSFSVYTPPSKIDRTSLISTPLKDCY